MESERLVCLRPRQRGVGIGNITPLLQEVKFRTFQGLAGLAVNNS